MITNMRIALLAALSVAAVPAAALAGQAQPSTDGAARAGSNAGSSSITLTHAPAAKHRKSTTKPAASHRMGSNMTGMGSQGANTTGPTSNSH